jgi:hypothetical protein
MIAAQHLGVDAGLVIANICGTGIRLMCATPLSDEEIAEVRAEARLLGIHPGDAKLFARLLATIDRERRICGELQDCIAWEHQQHDETRGYRQKAEQELLSALARIKELEGDLHDAQDSTYVSQLEASCAALRQALSRAIQGLYCTGQSFTRRNPCQGGYCYRCDVVRAYEDSTAGTALLAELEALRGVADKARNLNEECHERYLNEALAVLDALKETR